MLHRYYEQSAVRRSPPFRSEGYRRDGKLRKGADGSVLMDTLPPFLRTLIVTDGTVTKALEAFFWEPVAVDTVDQRLIHAEAAIRPLNVSQGDEILIRNVILRGENTGNVYTSAFSVVRPGILPADLRQKLVDGLIGIGVLIRDSGLESYREILDMGVEHEAGYHHLSQKERPVMLDQVHRTYRIIIGGRPVILITERFPWRLFESTR